MVDNLEGAPISGSAGDGWNGVAGGGAEVDNGNVTNSDSAAAGVGPELRRLDVSRRKLRYARIHEGLDALGFRNRFHRRLWLDCQRSGVIT